MGSDHFMQTRLLFSPLALRSLVIYASFTLAQVSAKLLHNQSVLSYHPLGTHSKVGVPTLLLPLDEAGISRSSMQKQSNPRGCSEVCDVPSVRCAWALLQKEEACKSSLGTSSCRT